MPFITLNNVHHYTPPNHTPVIKRANDTIKFMPASFVHKTASAHGQLSSTLNNVIVNFDTHCAVQPFEPNKREDCYTKLSQILSWWDYELTAWTGTGIIPS